MPVTNYIWDVVSDNVLMEKDDDDETIARYVQEPSLYGEAISQERDGQTRYYHYDGEGNTSELTDENENVTDTYEYTAFGEEVERTGTTENPWGYKGALGYYTDSTMGVCNIRRRSYQTASARWLRPDPARSDVNLYRYGSNSPIDNADPSGLQGQPLGPSIPARKCCVDTFTAPANRTGCKTFFDRESIHPSRRLVLLFYGCDIPTIPGFHFGEGFEMNASFRQDCLAGCWCQCCEYRQYIKGSVSYWDDQTSNWVKYAIGNYNTWVEDGSDVVGGPFGHRGYSASSPCDRPSDTYHNTLYSPIRKHGCEYLGADTPGVNPTGHLRVKGLPQITIWIRYSFRGEIIDVCNGNQVKDKATWTVDCNKTIKMDDVKPSQRN